VYQLRTECYFRRRDTPRLFSRDGKDYSLSRKVIPASGLFSVSHKLLSFSETLLFRTNPHEFGRFEESDVFR